MYATWISTLKIASSKTPAKCTKIPLLEYKIIKNIKSKNWRIYDILRKGISIGDNIFLSEIIQYKSK